MPDNLQNITLPINEWVDLYAESGVDVGTAISIENIGVCDVYLAVQATQPPVYHDSYDIVIRKNGVRVQNNDGDDGAWAYCNSDGGKLAVQPLAGTGFYPHIGAMLKTSDGEKSSDDNPLPVKDIDYRNRQALNTVFGEKTVAVRQADIAAQFQYGFPSSAAESEVLNGGTIDIIESLLVVSTGTNVAGFAGISNKKALRYLPGQEAFSNFTAVFTEPAANSYQRAGLFDSANGFFLGYEGTDFTVTRRRDSVDFTTVIDVTKVFKDGEGTYDPTKGNIYKISFGYLGFATINFEVLSPIGQWRSLHRIEYPNTSTGTHILNTNLQPRAEVANTGNNTDISIKVGSFSAGFVDGGGKDPAARRFTFAQAEQSIVAGTLMVITFRSKSTFFGITNYIQSRLTLLSFNTDLSKSTLWQFEKNADITNTPTWNDVSTSDSTLEYSIDAVVTPDTGELNFSIPLGKIDRELLPDLENQNIEIFPNEHITLFIISPLGTTGTYDYSFRWKELF